MGRLLTYGPHSGSVAAIVHLLDLLRGDDIAQGLGQGLAALNHLLEGGRPHLLTPGIGCLQAELQAQNLQPLLEAGNRCLKRFDLVEELVALGLQPGQVVYRRNLLRRVNLVLHLPLLHGSSFQALLPEPWRQEELPVPCETGPTPHPLRAELGGSPGGEQLEEPLLGEGALLQRQAVHAHDELDTEGVLLQGPHCQSRAAALPHDGVDPHLPGQ
mmetsp:Transcript_58064/g.189023  ORF Transcript_58064/g.189023 Transcript_58064/m.189023 type:complete len:215 (-) Transcript_58064:1078-1722(-)